MKREENQNEFGSYSQQRTSSPKAASADGPRKNEESFLQDLAIKRIQKDFTISGKIGEKDSDRDIGYLGVMRQIKEGQEKGYTDRF